MTDNQESYLRERELFSETFVMPVTHYLLEKLNDSHIAVRVNAIINLTCLASFVANQVPSELLQQVIQRFNALQAAHPDPAEEICVRGCLTKLSEEKQVHANALKFARTLTK